MNISLKPSHLARYKEILKLFRKYGSSDLITQFETDDLEDDSTQPSPTGAASPEELADDLERMGPTYVKLGQVLSSRPDLLPPRYLKALARLQDKVKPFPYEEVEKIVQEELGARISKAFLEFDPVPLAAASLGQVHRASLRDGRPVVVKVQRPGIRQQIVEDMEVLEEIARFLQGHTQAGKQYQFLDIFQQFQRTLMQELDYHREAANLNILAKNLEDFERIQIPVPIEDYTTHKILTMDYIRGRKITKLGPLARLEVDGDPLAEEIFRAYLKQILVDGIFHADPHPGNVFLTSDGRVALLDLGMVGRVVPTMQSKLLRLLLAVSEGDGDEAAELAIQASQTTPDFHEQRFRRDIGLLVAEQKSNTLQDMDVGKTVLAIVRYAGANGLFVPPELTMLGKTLLQLDEIGRYLSPNFNPTASIRRNASEIMQQRMRKELSPGKLFSSMMDVKDFVGNLPGRLNKILDAVANAELEVKVKATDVNFRLDGFQKIANRITSGLILAALIVGASLLMQVETKFQIMGYPGLAMVLFLIAAGMGLWLVVSIMIQDHKTKKTEPKNG